MGGRWSLRDIVDYSLISTVALLEAVADRRETILRNIFEINRQTVEERRRGDPTAIVIAPDEQHDRAGSRPSRRAPQARRRRRLPCRGRRSSRSGGATSPGRIVIPMSQVFARYAKDLLEPQIYPEVRRGPNAPAEPPYDVTAWSLGMLLGVDGRLHPARRCRPSLRLTPRPELSPASPAASTAAARATRSSTPGRTRRSRSTGC